METKERARSLSQRSSGYERKENDFYETPEWVTQELLRVIPRPQFTWEPACGSGKIAKLFHPDVLATDISSNYLDAVNYDFLKTTVVPTAVSAIITNPPFHLATEFCRHAVKLMQPVDGMVCMLLRCDFDHAKTRTDLFRDCPAFAIKLPLLRRIVWFERKGAAPSYNHAWFIWDWKHNGPPQIKY